MLNFNINHVIRIMYYCVAIITLVNSLPTPMRNCLLLINSLFLVQYKYYSTVTLQTGLYQFAKLVLSEDVHV